MANPSATPTLSSFRSRNLELLPFSVRIPLELRIELRRRALRSTLQLLAEHAYLLYIGGRLPPRFNGPDTWPENLPPIDPKIRDSPMCQFSVRLPRELLRWARVYAAEGELSEQELASRVFEWYVRADKFPPYIGKDSRDREGFLKVEEPLVGRAFYRMSEQQFVNALRIYVRQCALAAETPMEPGWPHLDGRASDGLAGERGSLESALQQQHLGEEQAIRTRAGGKARRRESRR